MENHQGKPKAPDEVDLGSFFGWIGRGFVRIGDGIIYSIASIRTLFITNKLFFLGVITTGLILGVIYSELLKKKYYKSTMVLSCDYLNTQILEKTIEKLNLLSKEKEPDGLAQELDIDINLARNIRGFEYEPFISEADIVEMEVLREQLSTMEKKDVIEKVLDRLQFVNKNAYQISVRVYEPDIVKPLEKALVKYFRESEYIKRRIEINRTNLEIRKAKLEQESKKLDSLKAVLFENFQNLTKRDRGSNNVILGDERLANPLEVFNQDLRLHAEILAINHQLYVQPDFELVDGFTTFKEPASASLGKILFISFWLSWIFGFLIIGAWRFDQMLAEYAEKQKAKEAAKKAVKEFVETD